jgi:drug/metabolite transporter (DMT)-like permease
MKRQQAVAWMLLVTLLWSTAGVVTKRLDAAQSFEVTFWRSAFNAVALVVMLSFMRGPRVLLRSVFQGGSTLALSSLCWGTMFTAFMVAMTMTTVANVLVMMALAPLFTAWLSRVALGHRLPTRTWVAIVVAGIGLVLMVGEPMREAKASILIGMLVATAVPVAAAVNWTLMQRLRDGAQDAPADMMPALIWGALLSSAVSLPLALPLQASGSDVAWLAGLGVFQLAVPCLIAVAVSRVLSAPELSLLCLCEVVFGVAWAWLGTSESPTTSVVLGGSLVVGALAVNEWLAMRWGADGSATGPGAPGIGRDAPGIGRDATAPPAPQRQNLG